MTFELGNRYNFVTYAPGILGGSYSSAKVIAIMDFNTAMKYKDVYTLHKQVYTALPVGTPEDPRDLQYILFQTYDGDIIPFATVWIDNTSVELASGVDLSITLRNVTMNDIDRVRDALTLMGYTQITIDVVSS